MLYDFYLFVEQFGDLGWCVVIGFTVALAVVIGFLYRPMVDDIVWYLREKRRKKQNK